MRYVFFAVSVSAICLLAFRVSSQSNEIKRLEAQANASRAREASYSLDAQDRCAKQALAAFKFSGADKEPMADLENHFNLTLNKCFVVVGRVDLTSGIFSKSTILSDAFEGRVFGNYLWTNPKHKSALEVPPLECTVTLPSGEEKQCKSREEFENLIKAYME
jgi:hypothetical protein